MCLKEKINQALLRSALEVDVKGNSQFAHFKLRVNIGYFGNGGNISDTQQEI